MLGPALVIYGCGPVGLLAAIRARQLGRVATIVTDRLPESADASRVECAPAQALALLVEFGVDPRSIGVRRLHEARVVDWSGTGPSRSSAPLAVHLGRPDLDLALLRLADRAGVRFRPGRGVARAGPEEDGEHGIVLDATGRRAVTAAARVRPPRPVVARILHAPAAGCRPELMIAAGPRGYAYRLASDSTVVLGIVGGKSVVAGSARSIIQQVAEFAPWLLADLPTRDMEVGPAGAASVQWSIGGSAPIRRVGDAACARDALASQGLAMGFGDALAALGPEPAAGGGRSRETWMDAVLPHLRLVERMIRDSPFARDPTWLAYRRFLAGHARADLKAGHCDDRASRSGQTHAADTNGLHL